MTSKTTNKFSPEVRTRAVRRVLDRQGDPASRWAEEAWDPSLRNRLGKPPPGAMALVAAKIGCMGETLRLWMKKAEQDKRPEWRSAP